MSTEKESDLTLFHKFRLYVKYRGLLEALQISLTRLLFPIYKAYRLRFFNNSFVFNGKEYQYFFHKYNMTWISERAVEIPIMLDYLSSAFSSKEKFLEIGNVLIHYVDSDNLWPIVDKYERGKSVINADVVNFNDGKRYDLILSVSTMEHVGFDEDDVDQAKIERAIEHIAKNLLTKNGKFIFTFPVGYNTLLDKNIFDGKMKHVSDVKFLKRVGFLSWVAATGKELRKAKYNDPYPGGNALAVVFVNAQNSKV